MSPEEAILCRVATIRDKVAEVGLRRIFNYVLASNGGMIVES
jgi:hypothetical protein